MDDTPPKDPLIFVSDGGDGGGGGKWVPQSHIQARKIRRRVGCIGTLAASAALFVGGRCAHEEQKQRQVTEPPQTPLSQDPTTKWVGKEGERLKTPEEQQTNER